MTRTPILCSFGLHRWKEVYRLRRKSPPLDYEPTRLMAMMAGIWVAPIFSAGAGLWAWPKGRKCKRCGARKP